MWALRTLNTNWTLLTLSQVEFVNIKKQVKFENIKTNWTSLTLNQVTYVNIKNHVNLKKIKNELDFIGVEPSELCEY